jgi:CHAT domain
VVMSLWKVRDDSTSQLMELYYRNLLDGQGRATALREAMRTLRLTHPHPHDWAPFIALGRDAPLGALAPHPSVKGDGRRRSSPNEHLLPPFPPATTPNFEKQSRPVRPVEARGPPSTRPERHFRARSPFPRTGAHSPFRAA